MLTELRESRVPSARSSDHANRSTPMRRSAPSRGPSNDSNNSPARVASGRGARNKNAETRTQRRLTSIAEKSARNPSYMSITSPQPASRDTRDRGRATTRPTTNVTLPRTSLNTRLKRRADTLRSDQLQDQVRIDEDSSPEGFADTVSSPEPDRPLTQTSSNDSFTTDKPKPQGIISRIISGISRTIARLLGFNKD